jgi:hypothetical protein
VTTPNHAPRVHCALCNTPVDGYGCPAGCRVLGEIHEGRVYAIGLPAGTTPDVVREHVRDLAERTKAELIVFVSGLTLVELESGALADARAARDAADTDAAKAWEERETYRHQVQDLATELADAHSQAEANHATATRTVKRRTGQRDAARAQVEQLREWLDEALAGWETAGTWSQGDPRLDLERIAEIRREVGLA